VDLCIPLSLLGNGSANMLPRQRGIVEGVVFSLLSLFLKNKKARLCDHHAVSMCIHPPPKYWMPEPLFMKLLILTEPK
jgi:hypothetical protein